MPVNRMSMLDDDDSDDEELVGQGVDSKEGETGPKDVELVIVADKKEAFRKEFFANVEKIKQWVATINEASKKQVALAKKFPDALQNDEEGMLQESAHYVKVGNKCVKDSYKLLETLKKEVEKNKAEGKGESRGGERSVQLRRVLRVCKLASLKTMGVLNLSLLSCCVCGVPFTDISQIRIKESMLSMLTTKYVAEVTRWRNSQKEFKSVSTTKTKYRLQSYDPEISNDDVEKIMLSEGGVDKFIHAHIVGTGETQAIREAYTKAQVRLSM